MFGNIQGAWFPNQKRVNQTPPDSLGYMYLQNVIPQKVFLIYFEILLLSTCTIPTQHTHTCIYLHFFKMLAKWEDTLNSLLCSSYVSNFQSFVIYSKPVICHSISTYCSDLNTLVQFGDLVYNRPRPTRKSSLSAM